MRVLGTWTGIKLEVIFTTKADEWMISFCLWLDVYAKNIGKSSVEMHLPVSTAAFVSASSPPDVPLAPELLCFMHSISPGEKSVAVFFLLSSIAPSPLTGSFPPSSKEVNNYLSFLQLCLLSKNPELLLLCSIHLSCWQTTWWTPDCAHGRRRGTEILVAGLSSEPQPGSPVFTTIVCSGEITIPPPGKLSQTTQDSLRPELLILPSPGYCFYLYI